MKKTTSLLVFITLLLLSSCGNPELEERLYNLAQDSLQLARTTDSLSAIVKMKEQDIQAKNADYETIAAEKAEMEARIRSLRSSVNAREKELAQARESNVAKDSLILANEAEYAALQSEMRNMEQKLAQANSAIDAEKREAEALAQSLREEEQKRQADEKKIAEMQETARILESQKGVVHTVAVGGGFGLGQADIDYSVRLISLEYILGYHFNKNFMAGMGTGVNFYNGGTMIPLFADLRYYFRGNRTTPYIAGDGGILFSLERFDGSGLFVNPMFGIRRTLNDKMSFHMGAGLLTQYAPAGVRHSFINIKGGISFKGK